MQISIAGRFLFLRLRFLLPFLSLFPSSPSLPPFLPPSFPPASFVGACAGAGDVQGGVAQERGAAVGRARKGGGDWAALAAPGGLRRDAAAAVKEPDGREALVAEREAAANALAGALSATRRCSRTAWPRRAEAAAAAQAAAEAAAGGRLEGEKAWVTEIGMQMQTLASPWRRGGWVLFCTSFVSLFASVLRSRSFPAAILKIRNNNMPMHTTHPPIHPSRTRRRRRSSGRPSG